ncbi:MAG: hypothetical protein K1X75_03315 [Leptospirales bacterium]|nr:hypothetical protein [Leptospirales bacterium]
MEIDMYIFQAGRVGQRFQRALQQAAHRGLRVTVIYDRLGSRQTPESFWQALQSSGARCLPFRPWPWKSRKWRQRFTGFWARLGGIAAALRIGFLRRDHRKLILIDARIAYTGGFNIMDECSRRASGPGRWMDVMYRTELPAMVGELRALFLDSLRRIRQPLQEAGNEGKRVPEAAVYPRFRFRQFRRRSGRRRARRLHVARALKQLIGDSRRRIYLMFPYFVPYGGLLRILGRQASRGLDVQIFLPLRSDVPWIQKVSLYIAGRLHARGVTVWLYHGRRRSKDPIRFNHGKVCLMDDWLGIGSANLDRRSLALNLETLTLRWRSPLLPQAERLFEQMRGESQRFEGASTAGAWQAALLYFFRRFL